MKKIYSICLFLLISSCSTFKKDEIDYSESYITGVGTESISSEDIRINLTRKTTMAGGNYSISAYPISRAYINAHAKELSAGKSLTKSEANKVKRQLDEKYLNDKACIDINLTIKEFQRVNNLENWRVTLFDSSNRAYSLKWLKEPPLEIALPRPISSHRSTYHGKETMWFLAGQACADANIEMKKGFKLVFKPSFVQWPFEGDQRLTWSFNYSEIIDGKKVLKLKKKRKVEGYRGW
ncbi:MAG: hypothetical protein ACJAT2_000147 [Bacteriovoracaceae bacterium]|jgi:hypothetical protein